ncbi:MAG: tetratricopeptide repeat protein [Ignavibacteriaceae bacterium]|nr:tetratricopeptide repeat protein [Ignavibacteriaceae bacterium]
MKYYLVIAVILPLLNNIVFPQSAQLLRGKEAYDNGRYAEAAAVFSEHLKTDPYNYNVHGFYINSLIGLKKYDEAIAASEKAETMFPSVAELLLVQAKLYIMIQQFQKAEKQLIRYLAVMPEDKDSKEILGKVYQNIGIVYYEKKDYESALVYFRKALPYAPGNAELHYNVVSLLIGTKKIKEAQRELESAMKKFPYDNKFKELYADVLFENKQFDKAVTYLEKRTMQQPDNIGDALKLGLAYRYNGEPDKALSLYNRMIKKHPEEKELYLAKSGYYSLYSDYKKMREVYADMAKHLPDKAEWKKKYAATFKDEGYPDSAIHYYKQIFLNDTSDAKLLITVAKIYTKENKDTDAIKQLEEIAEYDPANFNMFNLLHELYIKHSMKDKALASGINFYARYPYHHLSSYALGKSWLVNAGYDSALKYLGIAKRLNSKFAPAIFEMGVTYASLGNIKEAAELFKISIDRCINGMADSRNQAMQAVADGSGNVDLLKMGNIEQLNSDIEVMEVIFDSSFAFLRTNLTDEEYLLFLGRKLDLYPADVSLIVKMAGYYESKRKTEDAVLWYNKALFLNSDNIAAHRAIAGIYEKEGKYNQALMSWKRVLSIQPKNSVAYDEIIRLSVKSGYLSKLCDEWLAVYSVSKDPVLKERLLEALHKAGRKEEARAIL